jgi:KaiC/GvpD/RAD55 family RecA-like ATPase/CheY-like chemotaxis protein
MNEPAEIPLLTKALGGILPRHAYHFHGEPAVGKTVLGIQITHAWLQAGRTVLYLTADRPPDLIEHATTLGMSIEPHCRSGRLILAEYTGAAARQMACSGVEALVERLDALRREAPVTAVVFDPLDALIPRRMPRGQMRRAITTLIDTLQRRGWSTIVLSGEEMLRRNSEVAETLLDLCWATVALKRSSCAAGPARLWRRASGGGAYALEIEKARQATPAGRRIEFEIVRGAGLLPSPESEASGGDDRRPDAGRRMPRVLLASSEREVFLPLTGLLRRTVETEVVTDGVDALARAVTWNPDVIVAETNLPRLSGFAVARVLRQGRYVMPVILISRAVRRHSERVRAYLNGATDFLFFPVDVSEMLYKVRVASQMRLHTYQAGLEEHMLEVLLSKARSHILDTPTFLQAMGLSLQSGVRFSSPVSLVTFWLEPTREGAYPEPSWGRFRDLIDAKARNGDLICFPNEHRAAVLLCHETRKGASAFVRRLRRHVLAARVFEEEPLVDWRIQTSSQTLHVPDEGDVDLARLFDASFVEPTLFYAPGLEDENGGIELQLERRRWGT